MDKYVNKFRSLLAISLVSLLLLPGATLENDPVKAGKQAAEGTFTPDKAHSQLGFRVRHLGITSVNGEFTDYDAKVTFDPEDLSTLKAEATIQVTSIDTGIERRDNHLRSDDFFNAEQFPEMKFVSTCSQPANPNKMETIKMFSNLYENI
jgi:polyisoprenoid-binding protein YceI